jgi:hypothetical protein
MPYDEDVGQSLDTLTGLYNQISAPSRPYGIYPYYPLRRA